jgi:branched-chain amino acid transport system substrate-binding protein
MTAHDRRAAREVSIMRGGTLRWLAGAAVVLALSAFVANAQKKYGAGDTTIKIGQTVPFSGPASAYAGIARTQAAYVRMINDQGGINGRKLKLIQYDDAYSPPKAVEQVRKLVEDDEVLFTFQIIGTPSNAAVQKYLNAKQVPQLLAATGASKFTDPTNFPWTMGFNPNYRSEGRIYGKYILSNYPDARIGVLYQNDDLGRDYINGLKEGLGDKASTMIVAEASYEVNDPTIDSQIVRLKTAGADLLYDASTPKFAAQAIKKVAELDWHPIQFLTNVSASIGGVMKPAGYDNDQGILSTNYLKDPKDPQWKNDRAMTEWRAFMTKWYPEGDQDDAATVFAYGVAKGLEQVLRQCGDDLNRENIMKQAANLNFEIGVYLPGTRIKTSPTDFAPLEQLQMMRFKGESWDLFGPLMSGEKSS